jgi:propionyl-CoA synthetase
LRGVRRLCQSVSLASRIEDAEPTVVVSADAGSRAGKVMAYKPLLDEAIRLSSHKPAAVLLADRGWRRWNWSRGATISCATSRAARRRVGALRPGWIHRDQLHHLHQRHHRQAQGRAARHGGYAVALAASMQHIFDGRAGETYFSTSDIGWVVGHSYIVYGPLIAGMATIMYEGLPTQGLDGQPDGGIWWQLVEKYKVTVMFSAPTAVRVLKKQDPALLKKYDLSSLRRCSSPASRWTSRRRAGSATAWACPSSTTTGRPSRLADPHHRQRRGEEAQQVRQPGCADVRLRVKIVHESTGQELTEPGEKGVVVVEGPTPPGFMQTVWRDDARFVDTYWKASPAGWSTAHSTGASATPTAISTSSAAPTT